MSTQNQPNTKLTAKRLLTFDGWERSEWANERFLKQCSDVVPSEACEFVAFGLAKAGADDVLLFKRGEVELKVILDIVTDAMRHVYEHGNARPQ